MAFTLHGKVQVDNHGMYRALKGMQATVGPMGKQIGQQLRGKMLEAFGVGGGISIVKRSLQNAFDIRKEAAGLGVATDTLQTLRVLSDQTGASIEDMVSKMTSGTAEGNALAEAVRLMNEQLLEQKRIIDSGTVAKLSEAFEKIAQLMGRVAPVIAQVTDGLIAVFDWLTRQGDKLVGSWNALRSNDPDVQQAGLEQIAEGENPPPQEVANTPETQARVIASAIAAESRKEKDKTTGGTKSDGDMKWLDAGSNVAVGRYFGSSVAGSKSERSLETMNKTLADINSKISSFK